MKRYLLLVGLGMLAAGVLGSLQMARAAGAKPAAYEPAEDDKLSYDLASGLTRVTKAPYHVAWIGTAACAQPTRVPHSPHGEHWIHVLADRAARKPLVTGKGTYPENAVILKQKFLDAKGTKTDFYTGMRKRAKGYNPECGDWEFFTLSSARMVTARGKIDSCMSCHQKFKNTDFVSRRYLTSKEDPGWE